MTSIRRNNGITKKAQKLLARGESETVEFKRELKSLKPEILVAFANSPSGGTVFVGVEEQHSREGTQIGVPYGCPVGDEAKLTIVNKAAECVPPIAVKLFVENCGKEAFFRIEVPAGEQKPYCTPSGRYVIRSDGGNRPLKPDDLLSLFLESEVDLFNQRFQIVTRNLYAQLNRAVGFVGQLADTVESKMEDIKIDISETESEASSARSTIDDVSDELEQVKSMVQDSDSRIMSLIDHFKLPDPAIELLKVEVLANLNRILRDKEELLEGLLAGNTYNWPPRIARGLDTKIVHELAVGAAKDIKEKRG